MQYAIVSRGDETSEQIKNQLTHKLLPFACTENVDQPDLVISVGGDGTLLEAFHRYLNRLSDTAFVGVHTGRLGFYADWLPHEMDALVQLMVKDPVEVVSYPILEVVIDRADGGRSRYLALNESTIKTLEGSVVMNIDINDTPFEVFRGDGLCISTPSGSTAYNKSLAGAIVHPSLQAFQVAEMASINNRVYRTIGSPLILPAHHTCVLHPQNDVDYQVTIDHKTVIEKNVQYMRFQVATEKVRFARYRPFPFWKRVRDSFVDTPE